MDEVVDVGARVGLLSEADAARVGEACDVPLPLARLHVFRVLLRSEPLATAINDLLIALLFRSRLDDRLRELVIMRLGWATGCDYEWTQHWAVGREQFGCTDEDFLAVRDWRVSERFGDPERAVLAATDEVLGAGRVSPDTLALCREHVGDEVVCIELVAAIATWRAISEIARSLEIPLEPGVASWPPDGVPGSG
jgi:alkylhydroperoxidase family enzyme